MMSKEAAVRKSKVALRLLGDKAKNWTVRIWENLGWHYSLRAGLLSIYGSESTDKPERYSCLLSDDIRFPGCGSILWRDENDFETPMEAVKKTLERAKMVVDNLITIVQKSKRQAGL